MGVLFLGSLSFVYSCPSFCADWPSCPLGGVIGRPQNVVGICGLFVSSLSWIVIFLDFGGSPLSGKRGGVAAQGVGPSCEPDFRHLSLQGVRDSVGLATACRPYFRPIV